MASLPTEITAPERPVQKLNPIFTELPEADRLVRASEARTRFQVTGRGLAAAVLDTGLNHLHIDFRGRVVARRNFTGDDGGDAGNATDRNGHGTNVAGIICAGADHTGIAPRAGVAALKVLPDQGGGSFQSVERALAWVVENAEDKGISVVCMSLGDSSNQQDDARFANDGIRKRIVELAALNVVCCVASGNDYFTHGSEQGMGYPAILRETLSVGAVYDFNEGSFSYNSGATAHSTKPDQITPFSQRLHESIAPNAATDIFAPGAPIRSAGIGGPRTESIQHGTSQATPVVAGVVLLLQEFHLKARDALPLVADVLRWLRAGAVKITDGDDEDDNVEHTGLVFRRVDAFAALAAAEADITMAAFTAGSGV